MLDPAREVRQALGNASLRWSRCSECKKRFRPNPRVKSRQKTCGDAACVREHRARYRRQYREDNPGPDKEYRDKTKPARGANFWKNYRKAHPQSTERNRAHAKLRAALSRAGLQRQLDIVQVIDQPKLFELHQGFATSHRSLLEACWTKHAA